jgi:hypothetical protein
MIAPVGSPNIAEEQITAVITSGVTIKILGAAPGSEINQIFHVITNCQLRNYFWPHTAVVGCIKIKIMQLEQENPQSFHPR